jgi:ParB/RepB/Spo0J family partition protein
MPAKKHPGTQDEGRAPTATVVPTGSLRRLRIDQIKPSRNNPRHLFDPEPLRDLRENIRQHGVLVPITVYPVRGQDKFTILDGERRFRCCAELAHEGIEIKIPANVVEPPDKIAGVLYMFSIHNFREAWELMPTALSLEMVMNALGETDPRKLARLTGLSDPQIERCKLLLRVPKRFQELSLDPNPISRIPSNFWIESSPVLDLIERELPEVAGPIGRDGLTEAMIEKYRKKRIKSVIHFRRIMEAFDVTEEPRDLERLHGCLRDWIQDPDLETRAVFDQFVADSRRVQTALSACDDFISKMDRSKVIHALDRADIVRALERVRDYAIRLIDQLSGEDAPENVKPADPEE